MNFGLRCSMCQLFAVTFLAAGLQTFAQSIPVVLLPPSNAVLREEFSALSTRPIRELSDGRVLITETAAESRLIVADFKSNTVTPIGGRGAGPGEYTTGIGLHALGGDSTLMLAGENRWLLLNGANIAQTVTLPSAQFPLVSGVDTMGQILVRLGGRPGDDSGNVVLKLRRGGTSVTTIRTASSAEPGYPRPPQPRPNGGVTYLNDPWSGAESVCLFPDGWIAVARQTPFRVDWRAPDGKWMNGAPLPVAVVNVDEREKRAFMQRQAARSGAVVKSPSTYPVWPKRIPPFLSNALLLATPSGKLLIPRTPTADYPEMRYDEINRAGRLERQINLGQANRILGFGAKSVYVSTIDDDGIQRISRHSWP